MSFDPQTGEWIDDGPPPLSLQFAADAPIDSPVAATGAAADSPASQAAPPVAAAPTLPPPIDDSIQGAPPSFDAPHHWFDQPANDQQPHDPSAPAPEDPYAQAMASDAVSGGSTPDQQQLEAHQQYLGQIAGPPTVEAMQTPDQHAASVAGNQQYTLDDRMAALDSSNLTPTQKAQVMARMSPEDIAALNLKHDQEKINWQSTQQLQASKHAQEDAAANLKLYQDAQAKASADSAQREVDAKRIAATKIGHHIGIGEAIARIVLGAIGGAASQYTGGKNLALEQFQKNVDEDIANQTANVANQWKGLDQRKGAIADELGRHGDLFRAQETYRIAAYDRALGDIQTKAQDYDPNGTTAIRMAQSAQQIGGLRQKVVQDAAQQDFKNKLELGKGQLDAIKADDARRALQETERHNKAGEGLDWAKVSIEKNKATAEKKAAESPIPMDVLAARHPGIPMPPANMYPGGMTEGQFTGWEASQGKGIEAQGHLTENAQKTSAGQVHTGTGDPYIGDDGKPVQIAPDVAKEINGEISGAQQYVDAISKVKRELAADPSTFDRQKWAATQSHLETAAASWTRMYGAKASSREIEAAKEVIGADFSGYASRVKDKGTAIASLGAQIDDTKENINTQLKLKAGIKGKANLIDTSEPPPTKETPADKADKILTQNFTAADVDPNTLDADNRAFVSASGYSSLGYGSPDNQNPLVARAIHENIAPIQLQAFDKIATDLTGTDKERAAAADRLDAVSKGSKSAAVRAYALALIRQGAEREASSIGTGEDGALK